MRPNDNAEAYAPQRWSAELPAAEGWWWVDQPGVPIRAIIKVQLLDGIPYAFTPAYDKWVECKRFNAGARWAGPLPEPLDASDVETGIAPKLMDSPEACSDSAHWLDSLGETFTRRADNARDAKYDEEQSKWWAIGVEFAFREAACAVKARRAEIAKESNE